MKDYFYTDERNTQIVIYLMKQYGVRKVVVSPGATNINFVASIQQDSFFEIYSSVDERSAAYIACGMAAESLEPVALSCTGATASRNYMSGLTEAYYRNLPILAITSSQISANMGNLIPQVTDRTSPPSDIARFSVTLPVIHSKTDEWNCVRLANRCFSELLQDVPGPVHINLETSYSRNFKIKELPVVPVIRKYAQDNQLPAFSQGRIAIWVGNHRKWDTKLLEIVERFCQLYDAVVFCDHTSNYTGNYKVLFSLCCFQNGDIIKNVLPHTIIHIGDISGDYPLCNIARSADVWRVNSRGEFCDRFQKLQNVFEMSEKSFFSYYVSVAENQKKNKRCVTSYFEQCKNIQKEVRSQIPETPFSNIWIAFYLSSKLPKNSIVHLGILNTLRSWNLAEFDRSISFYSNTGGFGIDGILSTALGASIAQKDRTVFCVLGDLAFFYDINALGNRHVGSNLRILLINNGCGTEFKNYVHTGAMFGDDTDKFIAAGGHYGRQSEKLVRDFASNLGFEYLCAKDKKSFIAQASRFCTSEKNTPPMLFEVFTQSDQESMALQSMANIVPCPSKIIIKKAIKNCLGEQLVSKLCELKQSLKK